MPRRIITIDEEKCNGCGLCVNACAEGAIAMVDGKAKLVREDYCDGLGSCLPACPTGAISFIEKETPAEDKKPEPSGSCDTPRGFTCPGTRSYSMERSDPEQAAEVKEEQAEAQAAKAAQEAKPVSRLSQWPVQIKLIPTKAPFFENASLLVAADCTAFAYGNFHSDFIKNRITLIGCPKLDEGDYSEKLTEILRQNNIKSVTVVRMSVPCCGGLENAVKRALMASGKMIPWQVAVISPNGTIIEE